MTVEKLDVTEIPEVLAFMNVREDLESFILQNEKTIQQLRQLTELYNTALEAAEKKVRGLSVSCGPFDRYQTAVKYDAEKLYDAVGPQEFKKLGGTAQLVTKLSLDKKALETAIARNEVPAEVLEAVRTIEPRYHVPKKLILP